MQLAPLRTGINPHDLRKKACAEEGKTTSPENSELSESDFGFNCAEWDGISANARDFVRQCIKMGLYRSTHSLKAPGFKP
jgi:hypothetical protein